ncbi:tetratricopeptide repeat protein [candidate division WOR-3 bacterium]|nr:tetratricopeptide repeat protein [candidate division WOR-3 bacterium]
MKKALLGAVMAVLVLGSFACESSGLTALKVYLQQKRIPEAIREGEAAIAMEPNNPEPYYWTGVAYVEKQEYSTACSYLDKAVQRGLAVEEITKRGKGEGIDAWNFYQVFLAGGVQSLGEKKYEEAASYLKYSIQMEPDSATPYAILGSIFKETKQFDSMMRYYDLALSMDPVNFPAIRNLGIYYMTEVNDYEKAISTFQSARVHLDTSASLNYYLGLSHIQNANKLGSEGDIEGRTLNMDMAEKAFAKSAELDPSSRKSEIALYRGICLVNLERYEEAIPVINEALEGIDDADPNKDKLLYNLGLSYNKLEKYQEAVDALTLALDIKEDAKYLNLRADCYNNLGMREKAQEDLRRAQELMN